MPSSPAARIALVLSAVALLANCGGGSGSGGGTSPPVADTTPPTIAGGLPTGTLPAGTRSATMSVTTSESASCAFDTVAGRPYAAMTSTFASTGGTTHTHPLSSLADGQGYQFYVRCRDGAGNATSTDSVVAFSVAAATVACTGGSASWTLPRQLFGQEVRLAVGAQLHAVGVTAGVVQHRTSLDEGATWSGATTIPGAAADLPIYNPVAADGAMVYVVTRSGATLRLQRSADHGATWSAPLPLTGGPSDAYRVQVDVEGGSVHIFAGKAGGVPDPEFKVYYWRSTDFGQNFDGGGVARILDASTSAPPSPGGIAVEDGVVHIGYAGIALPGTLGHRARYLRSADNGATWTQPVDVGGAGTNPQIRPRPRVLGGRVFVLWEEPLDHNRNAPYPNATRSDIRVNVSDDNGLTWQGVRNVTELRNDYDNHPEVAVGPGSQLHVIYRLSVNQATLSNADRLGYRRSQDRGSTWCPHEIAIDDPSQETHAVGIVATGNYAHVASANGVYVRRPL